MTELRLSKDDKFYLDENDNKYFRVTSVVEIFFGGKTEPADMLKTMRPENRKRKHGEKDDKTILSEWELLSKTARDLGTEMHNQIEKFLKDEEKKKPEVVTPEFQKFLDYFWIPLTEEKGYKFVSAEEKVCYKYSDGKNEMRVAGTFDALFTDEEGNLALCDWKRSKNVDSTSTYPPLSSKPNAPSNVYGWHDNNWFHYSLQLNIYKRMYELKYPGKSIKKLLLVCMHLDHPDDNRVMEVKILNRVTLDYVFKKVMHSSQQECSK